MPEAPMEGSGMRSFGKTKQLGWVALIAVLMGTWVVSGQNSGDALERGFQNPPDSAKPRVWWHWMNGNITKEGIKLDLEWMKRVGIGGFQNFDAALNTPQIVEKRLVYMTPEWKDAFKYAATLADQLGLEMAIAGSPGWSESGGPWVPPAQAMKKFVWSETRVEGGRPFTGMLPKPPSTTGPFQNIAGGRRGFGSESATPPPEYYADSAVVAYRAPEGDVPLAELHPKVTSSGGLRPGRADGRRPCQGDRAAAARRSARRRGFSSSSPRPQAVRGLTLVVAAGGGRGFGRGAGGNSAALEASDDGQAVPHRDADSGGGAPKRTIAFPAVTARFFRVDVPDDGAAAGWPRRLRRHAESRRRGARRTPGTCRHPDRRARPAYRGPREPIRREGRLLDRARPLRPGDPRRACRRRYRAKPMSSI